MSISGSGPELSSRPNSSGQDGSTLRHCHRSQVVGRVQRKRLTILLILAVIVVLASNVVAKSTEKVLYRFTGGADGAFPSSSLLLDSSGNLYGTSSLGGDLGQCGGSGCGTVFELKPLKNGKWRETVLYAFQGGSDGANPGGNLVFDAAGNLYGTTSRGGTSTNCSSDGCGTVFELSPSSQGAWTKTALHDFQNEPDGALPSGLIFDAAGSLYGTTAGGGSNTRGTVYQLSPPRQQGGTWREKILYDFSGFGTTPNPGLVFDSQGSLYGTYYTLDLQFCDLGCGAVFQLKHTHGNWTETDLYDFLGGGNGGQPPARVILDSKGNLYGTGAEGGNNFGIVFDVRRSSGRWKESMLYNFCSRNNCTDGAFPLAGLVIDDNGVLYGTTYWGGTGCFLCGVVFKLSPTKNAWRETVLHSFRGGSSDGVSPQQNLILDGQGNLYGTAGTSAGDGYGIVFEVTQSTASRRTHTPSMK